MAATNPAFAALSRAEVHDVALIRNVVLRALQDYAQNAGFAQLLPVLTSPITDPLNHAVDPANIAYDGRTLKLTASMIFHKQLVLSDGALEKIFIVAPNIRLEKRGVKSSNNHLIEFSQFDLEMRNATMFQVMELLSDLFAHVFDAVRRNAGEALARLGRELPQWEGHLPVERSHELQERHGENFERVLSETAAVPTFITSLKREFYDREDTETPGTFRNFDLIYPGGFGEALSGAEREFQYDRIVAKMRETGVNTEAFRDYLALAEEGRIPQTAGAGIGIERLIRFVVGRRHIGDICAFDRTVGNEFVF